MNRQTFEKWSEDNNAGLALTRDTNDISLGYGDYLSPKTHVAWKAWQAAIASLDGYVVKNSTGSYTVHLKKEDE